jgi:hypothetical protein
MDKEELGVTPKSEEKPESDSTATAKEPEKKTETVNSADEFAKQQEELERTRTALKAANKEAADRRKRLDELEAAEAKRKEAEMTETEKTQARIKQLEAENAEREGEVQKLQREKLQRKVALAAGLPEALADRLVGNDEEAMTADAQAILAALPQPKQEEKKEDLPKKPKLSATNPGDAAKGETRAQVRERTLGSSSNPWGTGTVAMVEKD